jgi:hypothetical protein
VVAAAASPAMSAAELGLKRGPKGHELNIDGPRRSVNSLNKEVSFRPSIPYAVCKILLNALPDKRTFEMLTFRKAF